jgi:hypothetical protein
MRKNNRLATGERKARKHVTLDRTRAAHAKTASEPYSAPHTMPEPIAPDKWDAFNDYARNSDHL